MIDLHAHLLPAVDDGSPSFDVSVAVLERFASAGVSSVACTPHLDASRIGTAPHEEHARLRAELQQRAPAGMTILSGWEIMLDVPGISLDDPRLGIGGTDVVLVEFGRQALPPNSAEELLRLSMSGVIPLVAHPERYVGCSVDLVREWRRVGAVTQVGASSPLRSGARGRLALALLREQLVDTLASDTHGDHRSLAPARDWLLEVSGSRAAELLTRENAARILERREPLAVPAIEARPGMLERLRELLRRSRSR